MRKSTDIAFHVSLTVLCLNATYLNIFFLKENINIINLVIICKELASYFSFGRPDKLFLRLNRLYVELWTGVVPNICTWESKNENKQQINKTASEETRTWKKYSRLEL